jgi:hypothetical protein
MVIAASAQVGPASRTAASLPMPIENTDDHEDAGPATPENVEAMQARLNAIIARPPACRDAQQELVLQVVQLLHRLREVSAKISGADLYPEFQGKLVNDLNRSLMPAAEFIGELLDAHARAGVRKAQVAAEQHGIELDDATRETFAAVLREAGR